jgi:NAD(P)-dependent dehydrogenase (short-subunit alcohol dehydrogenase family)
MTKTVVITGGADGIGWATAQLFAEREFRVVIADLDGDKAAARAADLGSLHVGLDCDVSSEDDTARLVETLHRCDVLVNNAGIAGAHGPTIEQDYAQFRKVLEVHLGGTFLMSRALAPMMLDQGRGSIINLSSIVALSGLRRRNAYSAAKAGISQMTRTMATEWAGQGIRVNAVAPTYAETPFVKTLVAEGRLDTHAIKSRTPMGRLVQPQEVAEAIWFLASPAASAITGVILPVDCGWSAFGDFGDASSG